MLPEHCLKEVHAVFVPGYRSATKLRLGADREVDGPFSLLHNTSWTTKHPEDGEATDTALGLHIKQGARNAPCGAFQSKAQKASDKSTLRSFGSSRLQSRFRMVCSWPRRPPRRVASLARAPFRVAFLAFNVCSLALFFVSLGLC